MNVLALQACITQKGGERADGERERKELDFGRESESLVSSLPADGLRANLLARGRAFPSTLLARGRA